MTHHSNPKLSTEEYYEDDKKNIFVKLNDGTYRVIVGYTYPLYSEHIFDVRTLTKVEVD